MLFIYKTSKWLSSLLSSKPEHTAQVPVTTELQTSIMYAPVLTEIDSVTTIYKLPSNYRPVFPSWCKTFSMWCFLWILWLFLFIYFYCFELFVADCECFPFSGFSWKTDVDLNVTARINKKLKKIKLGASTPGWWRHRAGRGHIPTFVSTWRTQLRTLDAVWTFRRTDGELQFPGDF